jgi:hypothetical protein
MAKRFIMQSDKVKKSGLRLPHAADQGLHMIQVSLKGAPAAAGQTVLSLRRAAFERFGTTNVTGILQLACMDAEIAVGCLYQMLKFIKSQRFIRRQGTDNPQA